MEGLSVEILAYVKQFAELSKSNPALATFFGLYGAGVLAYVTKDVPRSFFGWVKDVLHKQFTISMKIPNESRVFRKFMQWYEDQGFSNKSRTLRASALWNDDSRKRFQITAGLGNHYFFHEGRIFKLTRSEKELNNSVEVKEEITLTTYGRSRKPFEKLLQISNPDRKAERELQVYKYSGHWQHFYEQQEKKFDTVVLKEETKEKLFKHIDNFQDSKEWYCNKGIPYRTGILLHGPGGTGKTSIVKALCTKYKKQLYLLPLNGLTDSSLESALVHAPSNAIILIEDIDAYGVKLDREKSKKEDSPSAVEEIAELANDAFSTLTMSGILNALDGVGESNGRIVVATTNYPETLDKALTRPGRFDLKLEIGHLEEETAVKMFNKFYPNFKVKKIKMNRRITPAEFQFLAMENLTSPKEVLTNLERRINE